MISFQTPSERGGIVLDAMSRQSFVLLTAFQTPSERGGIVLWRSSAVVLGG